MKTQTAQLELFKYPTRTNHFELINIGNSKIVSNTLKNQLIKVQQEFKKHDNTKTSSLKLTHTLTLVFEDANDGTTSQAIKYLTNSPNVLEIDVSTFGSILRFTNCKITNIGYELDYSQSNTAKYVVKLDVGDWNRTVH